MPPEAGFYGQEHALGEIEGIFSGSVRRITISGPGGQGKSALAVESARRLVKKGRFEAAVFIDFSMLPPRDALTRFRNSIASGLGITLPTTPAEVVAHELKPAVIILDNVESLASDSRRAVLDAAILWTESSALCVILTTCDPDFGHAEYKPTGTPAYRHLQLGRLGFMDTPEAVLERFSALARLPYLESAGRHSPGALLKLFSLLDFHPLSIRVLATELRNAPPNELGNRLERLLFHLSLAIPPDGRTRQYPLVLLAAVMLSLHLEEETLRLPHLRLGIFGAGGFEADIKETTGLMDDAGGELWTVVRRGLEEAGLAAVEIIPLVDLPFIHFHPALAPLLWDQLESTERNRMSQAWQRVGERRLIRLQEDERHSPERARATAQWAMPTLLRAAHSALDAGTRDAADFARRLARVAASVEQHEEAADLLARSSQSGSPKWVQAQLRRGWELHERHEDTEAAAIFDSLLNRKAGLTAIQQATALQGAGKCLVSRGYPKKAEPCYTRALEALQQKTDEYTPVMAAELLKDLGLCLISQKKLTDATEVMETSLAMESDDRYLRAQTLAQLGAIALDAGELKEAAGRFQAALTLLEALEKPGELATAWHLFGSLFEKGGEWTKAGRCYGEAARIRQMSGDAMGAADSWSRQGIVASLSERPEEAEKWLAKAAESHRTLRHPGALASDLNSLAGVIFAQPGRIEEARAMARESILLAKAIEPAHPEIWTTHEILARISDLEAIRATDPHVQEEHRAESRKERRIARDARRAHPGMRGELVLSAPLIFDVVAAVHMGEPDEIQGILAELEECDARRFSEALQRIAEGSRDAETICEDLDFDESMTIEAILQGLADPETISDLA